MTMRLLSMVLLAAAPPGMWLPQQIPRIAADLQAVGLKLEPRQLSDLTGFPMGAIVSLKGCSASFVSPDGLIVTNHHCVLGALQYNATPERDLIAEGFLAHRRQDEIPARPDARVRVTTDIRDVTRAVLRADEASLADGERWRRVERHRRELVAECEKPGGRRCEVEEFFGGESFLLFEAMEIQDVRLVYAPAEGVGNFGDEIDNWMWPRHAGDFGFYRAYVGPDGKPAPPSPRNVPYRPKQFLRLATRDLDAGDFVMVLGYPGTTHRLETAGELAEAQEFVLPTSIRYRRMLLGELHAAGAERPEVAIANASRIASLENYLKKHEGTLVALQRDGVVLRKREEEARLGIPTGELERALAPARAVRARDAVLEWLATASSLLEQAEKLVRLAENRARPDLERDEGYQARDLTDLWAGMERAQRQIEPGSDRRGLRLFLLEATRLPPNQRLGPLDRLLAATGAGGAEAQVDALLGRLYGGTHLTDLERRRALFSAGRDELQRSGDAMVELALALWPVHQEIDARDDALDGALLRLRPRLIAAQRAASGELAPDANGTLRIIYGRVEGYAPRDGLTAAPQTTIAGVLEKDTGVAPFNSPKRLLEKARAGSFAGHADPDLGTLPVDFLSTNSVTNGSSGSATLNGWGELCGLAFDTNLEAVSADYLYDPRWTRTIHVDVRYVLWVAQEVDGATELLEELGVGRAGSK
ncbi:MAG TPA: S46 family peptidase [Candidatus Polarisedimenticolaceae bacterium]|nr:S46 family peptidase [Candidatus Polarisedimenticolaceae bacterium]